MRIIRRIPSRSELWATFLCLLAVACGSGDRISGVPVKGRVVKNGQLLQLRSGDTLVMYFVSTEEGRRVRSMAIYKPADGTFVCNGPTRHGVPLGRQRIELYPSQADYPPYVDYLFNGEFKNDKSPLEIILTEGNSQNLVVDVGAKTVTAP
jgi:hypothetical protein